MTITLQAVNELIASLESAGELSIKERKYLDLAKAYVQLTAENVALKQAAEFATASDMWIEQADGMLDYRYHEWYVDVLKTAMETPATDRIYAGIKADGVEEFAAKLRIPGDDPFMDAIADSVAGAADSYAKQLREGAK
ncbi:Uncharacterised protein [Klebsiella pneumoniae]|uniref:hypothetical protein n=1 Tax=Klebsiella/Raoultella group TaxID=2890311 RepID=UPI0007CC40BF|nr:MULTISPECIES: hypothetical protein [Klebsiella/Raoultella group]SAX34382.1 Uncharacterised protein [Klebsiella pneumoniae]HDQ5281880.1 hypothetical protein [Raoultella ornithinolytica]